MSQFHLQPVTNHGAKGVMLNAHTSNGPVASLVWKDIDTLTHPQKSSILDRVQALPIVVNCYWHEMSNVQDRRLIITRGVPVWTTDVATAICREVAEEMGWPTDLILVEVGGGNANNPPLLQ